MNIEFSQRLYLALLAVVVVSFAAAVFLPVSQVFRGVASLPGATALAAVVFQVLRDKIRYEREKELQRKQQFFNLGVTSHMAGVAFDKHVEFCEKYIDQMETGWRRLVVEGPTSNANSLADKLAGIRLKSRTWLTEDILDKIRPYEQALRRIGADDRLLEYIQVGAKRDKIVDRMYHIFSQVTGLETEEKGVDEDLAHERIISHLQQVLGIQELTELRQKVMKEAIASIS